MIDQTQRLAQPGTAIRRQGNLIIAALMGDFLSAPHLSADLNDLPGTAHRRVERHAVETLHHLWTRRPDTQPKAAITDVVQSGGRHRQQGRGAGVDREDAGSQFDGRGPRREITQLTHRVVGIGLGNQDDIDAVGLHDDDLLDRLLETAGVGQENPGAHNAGRYRNSATMRSSWVTAGASGSGRAVCGNSASVSANSR